MNMFMICARVLRVFCAVKATPYKHTVNTLCYVVVVYVASYIIIKSTYTTHVVL